MDTVLDHCVNGPLLHFKDFSSHKEDYPFPEIRALYIQSLHEQIDTSYHNHFHRKIYTQSRVSRWKVWMMSTQYDFRLLFYTAKSLLSKFIPESVTTHQNSIVSIGESPNRMVCAMECLVPSNYTIDYIPLSGLSRPPEIIPEMKSVYKPHPDPGAADRIDLTALQQQMNIIKSMGSIDTIHPEIKQYLTHYGLDYESITTREGNTYFIDVLASGGTITTFILFLFHLVEDQTPARRKIYLKKCRLCLYCNLLNMDYMDYIDYLIQSVLDIITTTLFDVKANEVIMCIPLNDRNTHIYTGQISNALRSSSDADWRRLHSLLESNLKQVMTAEFPEDMHTNARCIKKLVPPNPETSTDHRDSTPYKIENDILDLTTGKAYTYCNVTRALIFHLFELFSKSNPSFYTEIQLHSSHLVRNIMAFYETFFKKNKCFRERCKARRGRRLYREFIANYTDSIAVLLR